MIKNGAAEINRIKALTAGQNEYIEAIDTSIITLCSGLAGTGKTYIAIGKAAEGLIDCKFKKIIISRPIVECGEKLGYLPGDVTEKIDPYMKPILDVLRKFFHDKELRDHVEKETIEFTPLAYMRGRTLQDSFMVLDEAQNATLEQIKMFLTRIGSNSKIVVSGDTTQRDIYGERGLAYQKCLDCFNKAPYIDGLRTVYLGKSDVVRHSIIQKIIEKLGE